MNGKQAKALRKALGIKKTTPTMRDGFQVINPAMNLYRTLKRKYVRHEIGPEARRGNQHKPRPD